TKRPSGELLWSITVAIRPPSPRFRVARGYPRCGRTARPALRPEPAGRARHRRGVAQPGWTGSRPARSAADRPSKGQPEASARTGQPVRRSAEPRAAAGRTDDGGPGTVNVS